MKKGWFHSRRMLSGDAYDKYCMNTILHKDWMDYLDALPPNKICNHRIDEWKVKSWLESYKLSGRVEVLINSEHL